MVVSAELRRDSAIHIHVSILPQTCLPSRLPHNSAPMPNRSTETVMEDKSDYFFARQRENTAHWCLKNCAHTLWWIRRDYVIRKGYVIRIKAVTVLHSSARFQEGRFVCRVFSGKCSGFLILMSLSGSLILPQMVHWLLFLWLAIVLVCETQRRSWRLESCL